MAAKPLASSLSILKARDKEQKKIYIKASVLIYLHNLDKGSEVYLIWGYLSVYGNVYLYSNIFKFYMIYYNFYMIRYENENEYW